jgi:hypothetical protein
MYFSSFDAGAYRRLFKGAGFELEVDEIIETHEPESPVHFLWLLARRT